MRDPWDGGAALRHVYWTTAAVHLPLGEGFWPEGLVLTAPESRRVELVSRVARVPERGFLEMAPGAVTLGCSPEGAVLPFDLRPLESVLPVLEVEQLAWG